MHIFIKKITLIFIAGWFQFSGLYASKNINQFLNTQKSTNSSQNSQKATRVHITQGHVKPDPIAFVPLFGSSAFSQEIGQKFVEVINHDLCGCGVFKASSPSSFLQTSEQLAANEPRFSDWKMIKTRFLICGKAEQNGNNVQLFVRFYDINRASKILAFSVTINKDTWRKAAHMAADQIYTHLTGEKGMFTSQLAYIEALPAKTTKNKKKISYLRQLKIMDQDGANIRNLTEGNNLIMTPRFSPDGKTIVYLAYKEEGKGKNHKTTAHVYLLDITTKRQRPLLTSEHFAAISRANGGALVNMTYAPRFSPDGKSICFSLIIGGKSAIYTMNIFEGKIRRLTNHTAIDTSPAYSPDGKFIVFTSNRSGKEKIYIMNVDGSHVRRITNGEGKYSQPVFSPRGDFIAFSKQIGNQFFIGVVRPNGQEERLIIQGYLAESPDWSPNGHFIIFIWQDHPRRPQCMCKIDLTGFFMQKMATSREVRDCSWSPLLG